MALRERGDLLERRKTFSLDRQKPNLAQFIQDNKQSQVQIYQEYDYQINSYQVMDRYYYSLL